MVSAAVAAPSGAAADRWPLRTRTGTAYKYERFLEHYLGGRDWHEKWEKWAAWPLQGGDAVAVVPSEWGPNLSAFTSRGLQITALAAHADGTSTWTNWNGCWPPPRPLWCT